MSDQHSPGYYSTNWYYYAAATLGSPYIAREGVIRNTDGHLTLGEEIMHEKHGAMIIFFLIGPTDYNRARRILRAMQKHPGRYTMGRFQALAKVMADPDNPIGRLQVQILDDED